MNDSSTNEKPAVHELLSISITGPYQSFIPAKATRLLADQNALVLDVSQSVIHNRMFLGILADFSAVADGELAKNLLQSAMEDAEMSVAIFAANERDYKDWTELGGGTQFVVSLLARQVQAKHLAAVMEAVDAQGFYVQQIQRQSGRTPLDANSHPHPMCVTFAVRGDANQEVGLRDVLAQVADELNVDIAFQADTLYRRTRRLICFDMDSTLIQTEVIDELAEAAGIGEQVKAITHSAMSGEIAFDESFRRRMALLKGLNESVLSEIADRLPLSEGAEHLFATLRKYGYKTAILSGGFQYFAQRLQAKLGIDYVFANQLDIVDGKVTGEVKGEIVNGERKASLLKELAEKEKINLEQVVAVGDGANDLPMLRIAGMGIAYQAKPLVKQEAEHAISTLGLDAILYLLGFRGEDIQRA